MKRSAAQGLRLAGRLVALAAVAGCLVLVGVQFAGIVAKNVAMANDLSASRAEIAALQAREREQRLTLRRLSSAAGALPEIHERLRLVGPHEELIYVREPASPPPGPDADGR